MSMHMHGPQPSNKMKKHFQNRLTKNEKFHTKSGMIKNSLPTHYDPTLSGTVQPARL